MERRFELSVVIPAYNESARIGSTLERVGEFLRSHFPASEVIVVDDGSTDVTAGVVEGFSAKHSPPPDVRLLKNARNLGKGASVKRGMLSARGKYILFSDADLSTPIEELPKLVDDLETGFHIAIASRALPGSIIERRQHPVRQTMGKLFNLLVQTLLFRGIPDTQCGFKAFVGEVAHELVRSQKLSGFAFDVELLMLARKKGYRIAQVPVRWRNSPSSRVRLFGDSARMFLGVLRLWGQR
jgi:dolichyl-phosphate beta-glucosyltransferase